MYCIVAVIAALFTVAVVVLMFPKFSHDVQPAAVHPLPPDVEPYVCYHQPRDKTSGFYSIKPVLSQLCWEIMFHRKKPTICLLGQKIQGHFPTSLWTKGFMLHNNCRTNTSTASRVRGDCMLRNSYSGSLRAWQFRYTCAKDNPFPRVINASQ